MAKKHLVPQESLPTEGFVRLPTVLSVLPMGRTSWLNGVKEGRFPKPVKLSPGVSAWKVGDIRELIKKYEEGGQMATPA